MKGVNVANGTVTHPAVAKSLQYECASVLEVLKKKVSHL